MVGRGARTVRSVRRLHPPRARVRLRRDPRAAATSTRGLRAASSRTRLPLAQWSDRSLGLAFLPVLRFDRRARWTPEIVDGYVTRASLIDPDAGAQEPGRRARPDDLTRRCSDRRAD